MTSLAGDASILESMTLALPILHAQPQRPAYAVGPRSLDAVKLLRISVTDRCNLRCLYCMPTRGVRFAPREDLLSVDDFAQVAAAARDAGVTHFKITGGEPTVRPDVVQIIRAVAALRPVDLSMTTNGLLLEKLAGPLRNAGLDRLTLSWDTMRPERFKRISRGWAADVDHNASDALQTLKRGIAAATDAGFERLKINVVVIGGINDDEVADFAALTLDRPWTVRFIEYMPLGESGLTDDPDTYTVDNDIVHRSIETAHGPLYAVDRQSEAGVGPAKIFRLPDALGRVGFISAMSRPFCESCNRLRLTATGELRSCLFDGGEVDTRPLLRQAAGRPATRPGLIELMRRCVAMKPHTHSDHGNRQMSQLGG